MHKIFKMSWHSKILISPSHKDGIQCFPIWLLRVNTQLISDAGTSRILYIRLENVKTRNKLQAAINYTRTILYIVHTYEPYIQLYFIAHYTMYSYT
jgi:hypothetical protein